MAMLACGGCLCQCSFGVAPAPLQVIPSSHVLCNTPAANILDNKPFANITPFGMCTNPANPSVAAATAAALGVLTPMPCIPVTPAPWTPGSPTVLIGGYPALGTNSILMCAYGGVIKIAAPAQSICHVP